jgi:hypothetical protein
LRQPDSMHEEAVKSAETAYLRLSLISHLSVRTLTMIAQCMQLLASCKRVCCSIRFYERLNLGKQHDMFFRELAVNVQQAVAR